MLFKMFYIYRERLLYTRARAFINIDIRIKSSMPSSDIGLRMSVKRENITLKRETESYNAVLNSMSKLYL